MSIRDGLVGFILGVIFILITLNFTEFKWTQETDTGSKQLRLDSIVKDIEISKTDLKALKFVVTEHIRKENSSLEKVPPVQDSKVTVPNLIPAVVDSNDFFANRTVYKCPFIYVDMGTNIGHQIRKLYEPKLYNPNPVDTQVFQNYFPASIDRKSICAFGFEANPLHTNRLKKLEAAYLKLNYPVQIYTESACGDHKQGDVVFYRDPAAAIHNEWGASLFTATVKDKSHLITVHVKELDMAVWFENMLKIYAPGLTPVIVMKSDIESADEMVLKHLLDTGYLCKIAIFYSEHISSGWWASVEKELAAKGCATKYLLLDDETGDDNLPLPHAIAQGKSWLQRVVRPSIFS